MLKNIDIDIEKTLIFLQSQFDKLERLPSKGYNETLKGYRNGELFFLKIHKSLQRFKNEYENNHWFKKIGFLCPDIIGQEKSHLVTIYQYIDGMPLCFRDRLKMEKSIHIMAQISKQSRLHPSYSKEIKHQYLSSIERTLSEISHFSIDDKKWILTLLSEHFYIGIFKDSKPNNWIVTNRDKIFIVDFDDVRCSFFLADLAQLLGYCLIDMDIDSSESFLSQFLNSYFTENKQKNVYRPLLNIAMIYSNIKKMQFCKDPSKKKQLEQLNQTLIKNILDKPRE